MRIYLASNYQSHPYMREVRSILANWGHSVTSRWINGEHEGDALDIGLQDHSPRFAQEDWDDLKDADICLWFAVGESARQRGGRHVEFGLALAWGIPIHVVGNKENVFHYLPQVTHHQSLQEAIHYLHYNIYKEKELASEV